MSATPETDALFARHDAEVRAIMGKFGSMDDRRVDELRRIGLETIDHVRRLEYERNSARAMAARYRAELERLRGYFMTGNARIWEAERIDAVLEGGIS